MSGGSGNDLLVGGEGSDTINAGDPSATRPGTGQDTIYGDIGSTTRRLPATTRSPATPATT